MDVLVALGHAVQELMRCELEVLLTLLPIFLILAIVGLIIFMGGPTD
jgi:hypothetical protein